MSGRGVLARTWRDPRARLGLALVAAFVLGALVAPLLPGQAAGDLAGVVARRFAGPLSRTSDGAWHLLGTDRFGRDVLARLLAGSRVSLAVGALAALVSTAVGIGAGAVAGYAGGTVDRLIVGVTDAALAIPRVPFLLLLVALVEPGATFTVLALGVTGWMTVARLVRGEVRALETRPFVEAARALGIRPIRVLLRHVLPNALAPALVATALGVGSAIMLEAGLSFLGLGVQPPTPSWGNMIASGRDALLIAPWVSLAPAAAVALVVLGFSWLGDALESALAGGRG
ncbi:MAG TPA: ABC transporter permease [Gemmatimonadales bacterium]|nr:ABC transporter permease [Gemmatimonadales bacterium]